jgi:hypothetical protein
VSEAKLCPESCAHFGVGLKDARASGQFRCARASRSGAFCRPNFPDRQIPSFERLEGRGRGTPGLSLGTLVASSKVPRGLRGRINGRRLKSPRGLKSLVATFATGVSFARESIFFSNRFAFLERLLPLLLPPLRNNKKV